MTRILQINTGVCRAAQDLALASAFQWEADILVISEQNRNLPESEAWFSDSGGRSAIAVTSKIPVNTIGPSELGFRWVEFPEFRLYSCYCTPNCSIADYKDFLLRLERSIRSSNIPAVAAGDFNAKSKTWGSPIEDARGTLLAELMSALDMSACNDGRSPTFVRGRSESHIDITFTSARIRGNVNNWRVLECESLSLHRFIIFDLKSETQIPLPPPQLGWARTKVNKDILSVALGMMPSDQTLSRSIDEEADQLVRWITGAVDRCIPKRQLSANRRPVNWWNDDIGRIRSECLKARRTYQRKRLKLGDAASMRYENVWKELRKSLAMVIKAAKDKVWSDLIATVDNDPWGKPYKVVMKRLRSARPIPGIDLPGRLETIVNKLFPTKRPTRENTPSNGTAGAAVSATEILNAAKSLPNGKAPGPDGITNEILRVAVSGNPDAFQSLFNRCFSDGCFPVSWKRGRLALIPKPGKPLENPSSYRPICLLDNCGKLLEKVVVSRLREYLQGTGTMADNQYGFRPGRSTLDALGRLQRIVQNATSGHVNHHKLVSMLTLDVKNAFNSAPWEAILVAARAKNVPNDLIRLLEAYLSERSVVVSNSSGSISFTKTMTCGVPQGSVLGPDLWNLLYDGLLKLPMPPEVELIAYADDVAIVCCSQIPFLLEERLKESFDLVNEWMAAHGLELAAEKSECIVITKKRVRNEITAQCGDHSIQSSPSLRYLGVQIDKKMNFLEHADLASKRAAVAARQLGFLMPNLRGPRQKCRRLLSSVVTSRLLYAAPIWAPTMGRKGWSKLAGVHRRSQLRVACCYSTVSHEAAAVVSGIPPIKLLAKQRQALRNGENKEGTSAALMADWQNKWNDSGNGRWTHRLIGDISAWYSRDFGEVTFHLTQVLTGHGCFGYYLHRFHLLEADACAQCGTSPDNAEHAFFKCDAWENWRREACAEIGIEELRPENMVKMMLRSKTNWTRISKLASRIMSTREQEERARQGQPV